MPPDNASAASGSQQSTVKPFKSDRKDQFKKRDSRNQKPPNRKEDANYTQSELVTHFSYVVDESKTMDEMTPEEIDVFLALIPQGYAIIDTGCTTSVIGDATAQQLKKHFMDVGFPLPQEVQLPAVELKGFNGKTETTTTGLKWTVCLGNLQGSITTYVIPGVTPFLLSRRVLEAMEAIIDLKNRTISSKKHGLDCAPLRQASNGHLLLPLCEPPHDLEIGQCDHTEMNEPNPNAAASAVVSNAKDSESQGHTCSKSCKHNTPLDKKRDFQTIVKNTKNGVVDVVVHASQLAKIFGVKQGKIIHAAVAYKPKKERVPPHADVQAFEGSVASLELSGSLQVSPWRTRPPSPDRRPVNSMSVAIFAYMSAESVAADSPAVSPSADLNDSRSEDAEVCANQPACFCCNDEDIIDMPNKDNSLTTEQLYDEEVSWVDLEQQQPMPESVNAKLRKHLNSLRNTTLRLTLSRLATNPKEVKAELATWLGDQAKCLDSKVGLIEDFTDRARMSDVYEKQSGKTAIRLGLKYGQDFTRLHDRRCLLLLIAWCRPDHLWFSFPCKHWGPWTRLNMSKNPRTCQLIMHERAVARRYLHNVSEAWNLQCALGGHCHAENPLSSLAWAELSLEQAWEVRVDQCAMGLRAPNTDKPVLKPTRIVTTLQQLALGLVSCRCDGRHVHEHLAGKFKGRNLTSWAETYPLKFCKIIVKLMIPNGPPTQIRNKHVEDILAEDHDELAELEEAVENKEGDHQVSKDLQMQRARALVQKVHVNTGHSSPEQMKRLANGGQSSPAIMQAIKEFKCSVCEELKSAPSHRKATVQHAESPNQVVGVDYVQVELIREDASGRTIEIKRNVLTVVDLATDFCQQVVVQPGPHGLSKAFHAAWTRPYGVPKTIYMDPDHRTISADFQRYLVRHDVQLLHSAAESHWQLGRVEVANRILRNMAQRVWLACPDASPEEVIETCATIRNEQLRKSGFSPVQWFLGRESRHAGSLHDLDEQRNFMSQSQVLADDSFAANMRHRDAAAKAFLEEHAKETRRRAISGRNTPMRGPYVQGQMVYMYRRQGRGTAKGMLATRHGAWIGPGRIIGMESSRNGPIPRLVWVSYNGYLYRCSPEGLRPLPDDEAAFRQLTRELSLGQLSPDLERASESLREKAGQFIDLLPDKPQDDDMELEEDFNDDDDDDDPDPPDDLEGGPRKIRRRISRSDEYWRKRAAGAPPLGVLHEGPQPRIARAMSDLPDPTAPSDEAAHDEKRRRVTIDPEIEVEQYEPTTPADTPKEMPGTPVDSPDQPMSEDALPDIETTSTACRGSSNG